MENSNIMTEDRKANADTNKTVTQEMDSLTATKNNQKPDSPATGSEQSIPNNDSSSSGTAKSREALMPSEDIGISPPDYSVQKVVTLKPDLQSLIPKEDQIVDDPPREARWLTAKQHGLFTPTSGMGKIESSFSDLIYAQVCVDAKGNRNFEFCQKIGDDLFTPILSISQVALFRLSLVGFDVKHISLNAERKKMEKCLLELNYNYLNSMDMKIDEENIYDIVDILKVIFNARTMLPEKVMVLKNPGEEFYERITDYFSNNTHFTTAIRKAYWALDDYDINAMAKCFGTTRIKLCNELVKYDLLYRQASSKGFQAKIRINGIPIDRYCIYNLAYFDEITKQLHPDDKVYYSGEF